MWLVGRGGCKGWCCGDLRVGSCWWGRKGEIVGDGENIEKMGGEEVEFGVWRAIGLVESPVDTTEKQQIDEVIARIARGRYLMTSCFEGSRAGALVDSVQWLMTEPLLIGVSVRKGHEIDPLIRDSRAFAVGFINDDDRFVTRRFGKRLNGVDSAIHVEGLDPFETLETSSFVTGSPVLPQCSTWVDCEVLRRVDLENAHELFVGSVVGVIHDGQRIEVDPSEFGDD